MTANFPARAKIANNELAANIEFTTNTDQRC